MVLLYTPSTVTTHYDTGAPFMENVTSVIEHLELKKSHRALIVKAGYTVSDIRRSDNMVLQAADGTVSIVWVRKAIRSNEYIMLLAFLRKNGSVEYLPVCFLQDGYFDDAPLNEGRQFIEKLGHSLDADTIMATLALHR